MNRAWLVSIGLFLLTVVRVSAQTEDSLAFSADAMSWTQLPPIDSLSDQEVAWLGYVVIVQTEFLTKMFENEYEQAKMTKSNTAEAIFVAKSDSTVSEATQKELASQFKAHTTAAEARRKDAQNAKNALKVANKLPGQPAKVARKNTPKAFAKMQELRERYSEVTTNAPIVQPNNQDEPVATSKKKKKQKDSPERITDAPSDASQPETSEPTKVRTRKKKSEQEQPASDSTDVTETQTKRPFKINLRKKDSESASDSTSNDGPVKDVAKPTKAPNSALSYVRYDPKNDVMITPPVRPCVIAIERKDQFTGTVYRECQREEWFRHTNEIMKKVLPVGTSHIVCEAALANDGVNTGALSLKFVLQDPNARRAFGNLPKNGVAVLRFLNGEALTIYNTKAVEGQFDIESGLGVYVVQYSFDKSVLRRIEKGELDQVRIQWGTGYEDYSIQQVDLLQRQAACLK